MFLGHNTLDDETLDLELDLQDLDNLTDLILTAETIKTLKTKLDILTSTYKGTNLSKPNKLTKLRL